MTNHLTGWLITLLHYYLLIKIVSCETEKCAKFFNLAHFYIKKRGHRLIPSQLVNILKTKNNQQNCRHHKVNNHKQLQENR